MFAIAKTIQSDSIAAWLKTTELFSLGEKLKTWGSYWRPNLQPTSLA